MPKTLTTPYEATRVFTFTSPSNMLSFNRQLDMAQLPRNMAVVILTENQHYGVPGEHCYNFKPNNVRNVRLKVNGTSLPNANGIRCDSEDYSEAYNSLFTELNAVHVPFPRLLYHKNYTIFGFNLRLPDRKPTNGICELSIEFSEPNDENLVVLLFCSFDSKFSIDTRGNFTSEISPKL